MKRGTARRLLVLIGWGQGAAAATLTFMVGAGDEAAFRRAAAALVPAAGSRAIPCGAVGTGQVRAAGAVAAVLLRPYCTASPPAYSARAQLRPGSQYG